jgi:hypothetical protein
MGLGLSGGGSGGGGQAFHWLDDRESDGPSGRIYREASATGAVISGQRTFELAGHGQGDHHDGVPILVLRRCPMWLSLVGLFMGRGTWSWIVPDGLWELARPLIPEDRVRPQGGGTQNTPDETLFAAIIYVLVSGCAWRALPPCFGISKSTAHRGS